MCRAFVRPTLVGRTLVRAFARRAFVRPTLVGRTLVRAFARRAFVRRPPSDPPFFDPPLLGTGPLGRGVRQGRSPLYHLEKRGGVPFRRVAGSNPGEAGRGVPL